MFIRLRRGKKAASLNLNEKPDGYIETLRPEGSSDGTKIPIEWRALTRPDIDYRAAALNVLIPLLVFFAVCLWNVLYAAVGLGVYLLICLRWIIIWFIRVYQHYASDEVRLACVFEPSCSQYAILAIKKYGVIIGGIKSVRRLLRCHYPNGGEDHP